MRPPETEFGRGIRRFGLLLTQVIMLLVLFVLRFLAKQHSAIEDFGSVEIL